MIAPNLSVAEIKAFVPARDFERSKRFYTAIGFEPVWSTADLACFRHGGTSFLLQDFFVQAHAENFVMHLLVDNVDDWWQHLQHTGIAATFGVAIGAPESRPWGQRDFTLFDPSGVLWRIGQNTPP